MRLFREETLMLRRYLLMNNTVIKCFPVSFVLPSAICQIRILSHQVFISLAVTRCFLNPVHFVGEAKLWWKERALEKQIMKSREAVVENCLHHKHCPWCWRLTESHQVQKDRILEAHTTQTNVLKETLEPWSLKRESFWNWSFPKNVCKNDAKTWSRELWTMLISFYWKFETDPLELIFTLSF